jgi:glutamine cyclotransferase
MTQGLAYHDGRLFESTGPIESSSLRELSLTDGSTLRYVPVPGHHAEGLAVLNNTLYQLTWTSQKAFLYDVYTLERQDERAYEGEGWGLCMGNNSLLMSNGTSEIVFRNAGFKATARIHVRSHGIPVRHINDIQQVGKFVYANVLNVPSIYVISLESGQLVGIVDCVRLLDQEEPDFTIPVLNGIAHCVERSTLFITGKYLPRLYEIALPSWRQFP